MKLGNSKLNQYALLVEDAQTEIRSLIKRSFLQNESLVLIRRKISEYIKSVVSKIKIKTLALDCERSLMSFADKQYSLWKRLPISAELLIILGIALENPRRISKPLSVRLNSALGQISNPQLSNNSKTYDIGGSHNLGVPLQKYYNDVWNENVKPILYRLIQDKARDPNDQRGYNTLRNLAEMEVRYDNHKKNIEDLRQSGERIILCSSHADCSERCAPWQGRFYSLDGTYGTIDGHDYVPLEVATDIYYTTKAGRVYKNGLFGFNCRHFGEVYRGQRIPRISKEEMEREYKITQTQRALELKVRKEKESALIFKGINRAEYLKHRKLAIATNKEYLKFCKDNDRPSFPMRVEI